MTPRLVVVLIVALLAVQAAASSRSNTRPGRAPGACPGATRLPMSVPGPGWGRLVGASPLWVGIYGRVNAERARVTVTQVRRTKLGWRVKFLWVTPREHTAPITISIRQLSVNRRVWIRIGGLYSELSKGPLLDPARPSHPGDPSRPATREWGSYVYFPRAGCYSLAATWTAGAERFTFGFGRP